MAEAMLGVNIEVIAGHLKMMFPQYDLNILTNVAHARTAGLEGEIDMDIIMSNCIDDLSGMDARIPDDRNGDIFILESPTELPRSYRSLNASQGTGDSITGIVDLTAGSPETFASPRRKRRRESQDIPLARMTYVSESSNDDLDLTDGRSSSASVPHVSDVGDADSSHSSTHTRDTASPDSLDDARDTASPDSLDDADSKSGTDSLGTRETNTPDSDPYIQDNDYDLPDIVAAAMNNVYNAIRPAPIVPAATLPNSVVTTAMAVHGKTLATATTARNGVVVRKTSSGPMQITPILEQFEPVAKAPRLVTSTITETQAGPVVVDMSPVVAPRSVTATATATQAGPIIVTPIVTATATATLKGPPIAAPDVPRVVTPEVLAPHAVLDRLQVPPLLPLHDPFPELLAVPASPPRVPTPVPEPPPREPTPEEVFEEKVDTVLKLFPLVDPEFVRTTMKQFIANEVEFMVNQLLEDDSYPRLKKKVLTPTTTKKINYFDVSRINTQDHSQEYKSQCHQMLQADFRKVSVKNLRKLELSLNFNYALIYKVLVSAKIPVGSGTDTATVGADSSKKEDAAAGSATTTASTKPVMSSSSAKAAKAAATSMRFVVNVMTAENKTYPYECQRLKCGRYHCHVSRPFCAELEAELEFVQKEMREETENKDRLMAELVNESEYEETGQLIECGCCYGEIPFEQMVQCYEGHLFCRECLTNYAKEAVYGQGRAELTCMSDGCPSSFPKDQLERALPTAMIEKYEERLKDEALNLAGIEDLVRCPHCDYAACLPPEDKVFTCQNPTCLKETCRHCKEDWTEHFGIPCSELEKKDETQMRLAYEEKMTQAMMRVCHRCKASFTKTEGCNRMTCRCKASMCYICRKPEISYEHFCRHLREPGKGCDKCKECSLWSDPKEDDERAVQEVKKAAMEERKAKGYDDDKEIGAPDEPKKEPEKPAQPPAAHQQGQPGRPRHQNHHQNRDRELDRERYRLQLERHHYDERRHQEERRHHDERRHHHEDRHHDNRHRRDHRHYHDQLHEIELARQRFAQQQAIPLPAHNNHVFHYAQQVAAENYAGNQGAVPNQQVQGGAQWNEPGWY